MKTTFLLLSSFALLPRLLFSQGAIVPTTAPNVPIMKTLQQIEPRTDLKVLYDQNHDGVGDDARYEIVISEPGSYYLSANMGTTLSPMPVTRSNAIHVTAVGITIDLNGFQIQRTSGSGGNGLEIGTNADRCTVKNGSLSGFANGLICASGRARGGSCLQVAASGCSSYGLRAGEGWEIAGCKAHDNPGGGIYTDQGNILSNCTAYGNQSTGISVLSGSTLSNCSAQNNSGTGISAGTGCALSNCSANNNAGQYGIYTDGESSLTNCAATSNTSASFSSWGIYAADMCTLTACTVTNNTNTNATVSRSSGAGILAGANSTIHNCIAQGNKGDGITVGSGCEVKNCSANGNGSGTTGSGIDTDIRASISGCSAIGNKGDGIVFSGDSFVLNNHASTNGGFGFHDIGSASRVDGNVSRDNIGIGIYVAPTDTVVRNNSGANGNGTPSNQYGPTVGANWGPVGTANTSTSPWANF